MTSSGTIFYKQNRLKIRIPQLGLAKLSRVWAMVMLILFSRTVTAQITLDQNVGEIHPWHIIFHCNPANYWGRIFELSNFGVLQNEELIIDSAEIAFVLSIYNSDPIFVRFNIYEIDADFPDSFPDANLLGSSQTVELKDPSLVFGTGTNLQKLTLDFDVPVVVPINTKRILVEVEEIVTRPNKIIIAYTEGETDPSWFHPIGCAPDNYVTTADYGYTGVHYYLKAFGSPNTVTEHNINHEINCGSLSSDFGLTNTDNITSVEWDFGDPDSGTSNNSTAIAPFHEFTSKGTYIVTAKVTTIGKKVVTLKKNIEVFEPVRAYPIETIFSCEDIQGTGLSSTFDTSDIESIVLGEQTGLEVSFFNVDGTPLPSPLSNPFQNTVPYRQTILVRVTSKKNLDCFSETSFELVVNAPLEIDLKEKYHLCDPETALTLSVNPTMDFWEWRNEAGIVLSNSYLVDLTNGGNYSLTVEKKENGLLCEKTFSFSVEQPKIPKIDEISINDFSSSNTVEVLASAEEAIEYSIDGLHYQNSNLFLDVLGGAYTMHVRNINGCGTTTKNFFILDYPKFFTPNNDGVNDYWHIKGIEGFSNVTVQIFDRYGKLLKQLTSGHLGWDGTLNGRKLPSSDYWFVLKLQNGRTIKNHFTLKR
ncbi:T9SS type B sorting domain-containing protein [Flagellimonas sp. CMM7]|uniref:T9SS type B sorting domain-containing protein n=1 Tax=Flagellimonas sp. CMM7 TaxID=2654676 RepID=UPI0013D36255|nr:T9SS type B sorting domain-containing protein [Flagellimonas sp. CMM7]UII78333.1 T9SS type B sorting domain-containing protein [Flagellimonas sp. CMM7]